MADQNTSEKSAAQQTENVPEGDVRSSFGVFPLVMMAIIIGIGIPSAIWLVIREPEMTPFEKTVQALEYLDQGRTRTAYLAAIEMLYHQVDDPEVGGALEYVVGVAYFRKAERVSEEANPGYEGIVEPIYQQARTFLEQANRKSLMTELIPDWRYTLGSCYYKLGQIYNAREMLEAAYDTATENRDEIVLMLAQCYLDPNVLKSSLVHPDSIVEMHEKRTRIIENLKREYVSRESGDDDEEYRYRSLLCIAELQRQDGDLQSAKNTVSQLIRMYDGLNLSVERRRELSDTLTILKSRILIDSGKTEEAREVLVSIVDLNSGLEQKSVLQGYYLYGLSYEADGRLDLALENFEKPAAVSDSSVSFPANLYAGDIARKRGSHEEALNYLSKALAAVESTDSFANEWVDLNDARKIIQEAWDEWGNSDSYEQFRFSIDLAQRMVPLFPLSYSNELTALASQKRARLIQNQYDNGTSSEQITLQDVREHWKRAGYAYARLANSSRASANYSQILWDASQFYRNGNDFPNALNMLDRFIASNPRAGLPAAYTFKAQLLLDLDGYDEEPRLEQAIEILEHTIRDFPKDQLVYGAQLMLGRTYLEVGLTDEAIATWRELLLNSPLTPEAEEWQQALFLMGRTLFHTTETRPQTFIDLEAEATTDPTVNPARYEVVDEAIFWLDEFVRRIPDHPRVHEARWLLAKGLRFRARRPEVQLKNAETENMKNELKDEIYLYLDRSLKEYSILSEQLQVLEQRDQLDAISRQFLRDAYFEPAHIQFDLGQFDSTGDAYRKAIDLYSNAAFYFTTNPIVLVAYYRIAECYRHLNAYGEGRRQLEQAKVILNQIPEPFPQDATNFTKQEWDQLLEQSIRLYDLSLQNRNLTGP
ncbi:MAG: tetratricopeptide repeat protein [Planctomycetaceae bacterium]|nr:tetratricopeptide repeat protein [Planctomycetaceae bacterium]